MFVGIIGDPPLEELSKQSKAHNHGIHAFSLWNPFGRKHQYIDLMLAFMPQYKENFKSNMSAWTLQQAHSTRH